MARPPTIGELRERGAMGVLVSCRFCRHGGKLTFEQLRASDDQVFVEVMQRRRLRCTECDADKVSFTVEWGPAPGGLL